MDETAVFEKLNKTGGTPYYFENLSVDIEEGLMVRVSSLNALRRDALEKLSAMRSALPELAPDYSALASETALTYETEKTFKTFIRIDSLTQLT